MRSLSAAVRYPDFVERVFQAIVAVKDRSPHTIGGGLQSIATELGFDVPDGTWTAEDRPGWAIMCAVRDLDHLGLVESVTLYMGSVTPTGREAWREGLPALRSAVLTQCRVTSDELGYLARLVDRAARGGVDWACLTVIDPQEDWMARADEDAFLSTTRLHQALRDLHGRGLLDRLGNAYRPTYAAAVVVAVADPLGGPVIDWPLDMPGWGHIEGRIGELKLSLRAARTEDDVMTIGPRVRELLIDVMRLVFDPATMVPAGSEEPGRSDVAAMLDGYLAAVAKGGSFEPVRRHMKASMACANLATHRGRLARVGAMAAAQGAVSFIRTIQALEAVREPIGVADDRRSGEGS